MIVFRPSFFREPKLPSIAKSLSVKLSSHALEEPGVVVAVGVAVAVPVTSAVAVAVAVAVG